MSKKEKLLKKLYTHSKGFTFSDVETLLAYYNYHKNNKGKTSGSRVMFVNSELGKKIILHKPHPRNELLDYQIKQLIDFLSQEETHE